MTSLLRNTRFQRRVMESAFLIALLGLILYAVVAAKETVDSLGMTSGFGFLERTTGFDIGFSLIEFDGMDSYGRLLLAGIVNTLFLGAIGIVGANLVGLVVAVFKTSRNGVLNLLGTVYVETFRNVPLILQVVFWYATFTHLPSPRSTEAVLGGIYLTSRGLFLPGMNTAPWGVLACIALLAVMLVGFVLIARSRKLHAPAKSRLRRLSAAITLVVALAILFVFARVPGTPLVAIPELRGLNIRGGISLTPELAAMIIAIASYGGAYIAEILRAGFNSVGVGQIEAGRALGLSDWDLFNRIRMPLAIRAVLPTLINQYVWLMKATTLGVAVGFADFFSVVSVSINQSGQTLELIGLLMLGFLVINNTMSIVLNWINRAIRLKGV